MLPDRPGIWLIDGKISINVFLYDGTLGCHVQDQHGNLWPMKVEFLPKNSSYHWSASEMNRAMPPASLTAVAQLR